MEVILREEVDKLGIPGEVVKVAPGYARNYLIPRNLAVPATSANKKIIAQEKEAWLRKETAARGSAEELAKLLASVTLSFTHRAGDSDQLFGSVTSKDIADALAAQSFTIDRKKILLDHPIKQLGRFTVPVKLHREVVVELPVSVLREGSEPAAEPETVAAEAVETGEAVTEVVEAPAEEIPPAEADTAETIAKAEE